MPIYRFGNNFFESLGDFVCDSFMGTYGMKRDGTVDNNPMSWDITYLIIAMFGDRPLVIGGKPNGRVLRPMMTKVEFETFLNSNFGLDPLLINLSHYVFV